jgi:hypothetical protein
MYAGNKVNALMSIFPDIGLDPKKFANILPSILTIANKPNKRKPKNTHINTFD